VPRVTPDNLLAARDAIRTRIAPSGAAPAKTPAPQPVPPLSPNWPVEIRLDKGRRMRATLVPGAATRDDVAAFREASAANTRRAFEALQEQGEALEGLKRSHAELTKKVAVMQAHHDRSVVGLLQGIADLEQRLQTATLHERVLQRHNRSARTLVTRQQRELSSITARSQINQVNGVVNSMQAAAFGEKGRLFTTNNVLLAANQLAWQFVDPILRTIGFPVGPSPSLLMWLSPVGSLLTGQMVVGNRQHVRFITGVATFTGNEPAEDGRAIISESLKPRLAKSFFEGFRKRTDVPVTTVVLDPNTIDPRSVTALVRNGTLFVFAAGHTLIELDGPQPPVGRVAWMVDTGVDGG
jgi:hypothetical protein